MSMTIEETYSKNFEQYNIFCKNIVEAVEHFLKEKNIPYLSVNYRIKEIASIKEKILRKGYENPFEQIEDICGIRIVCFYTSDIEKINKVLVDEFKILEQEDKSVLLNEKEFGYRSSHFILKIDPKWTSAPNYRNLENYKAEIQVRTILMHAWAEIEHKLNYKNQQQAPEIFRRKLYRLSAKFEEADEQFEDLKNSINSYVTTIQTTIKETSDNILDLEFNLDTFKSYLEVKKGDYSLTERYNINSIFDDFVSLKIGFKELDEASEYINDNAGRIIKTLTKNKYYISKGKVDYLELLYFSLQVLFPEIIRNTANTQDEWKNSIKDFKK